MSKRPPAMTCASPSVTGLEPGLEVLITGGLHLAAQPCQGPGLGGRRAQAEEIDGLPPCISRVLDRLQLSPPGGRPLPQAAGEPGERPVGESGCQAGDAVAQAKRVDEDREVVGGEDLGSARGWSRSPRPGCRTRRWPVPGGAGYTARRSPPLSSSPTAC